jgi:hypothetical protein
MLEINSTTSSLLIFAAIFSVSSLSLVYGEK